MAHAEITTTTTQAQGLIEIRDDFAVEAQRLVESAKTATERRRPGMISKAEQLAGWASLLTELIDQVPEDIVSPPPPPEWLADGYALVPGQDWPHRLDEDGNWVHPDNSDEYAEGITAKPRTTEELIEAGAVRLPAIVRLVGDHEQQRLDAAAEQQSQDSPAAPDHEQPTLPGVESDEKGDDDEEKEEGEVEHEDLSGLSEEELDARLPQLQTEQPSED